MVAPVRQHSFLPLMLALVAAVALPGVGPGISAAESIGEPSAREDLRAAAVSERSVYGLPVDDATITALLDGGADTGTSKWGIPLTAEEETRLDLPGRMRFAEFVNRDLIPVAEAEPAYGGAWFDQRNDGGLVIALTSLDVATIARIEGFVPQPSRGLRFVGVSHSLTWLEARVERLERDWAATGSSVEPVGAGIDVLNNGLTLHFYPEDLPSVAGHVDSLAAALGVPIVPMAQVGHDTCTDRDWCGNPLRIGNMIRRGSYTNGYYATMGFHITIGTDHQFLTAGHAGYSTPNTWYHKGLYPLNDGLVGGELATLYADGGKDIMRVQMANSQASELIYGVGGTTNVNPDWGDAQVGETLCRSAAKTDDIDCGTVLTRWTSWTSDTANPDITVWGGRMDGIVQVDGDSGAPLYRLYWWSGNQFISAIGIMDHENGGFAWVKHAIQAWGGHVYDGS